MARPDPTPLPPELQPVERLLRHERVQPTALELDGLKLRVKARRSSVHHASKGSFVKSRIGISLVLVLGLMVFGTGSALAVSGISGSGSAAKAQYNGPGHGNGPGNGNGNGPGHGNGPGNGNIGNSGAGVGSNTGGFGNASLQSGGQQGANGSGGSLPFTGYLAIPVLLIGVGLLGSGLVLRRRAHSPS